ncbi:hypothetical protein [Tautonia plasticadhaerens]|uniref:HEAT repeat protein n=1 Tax=Tautonia plasticadhaerens TaxID=2527974 RepID=A0A518H6F7_9BACT|nr:hypothetical protein [Tautonia plasticadhaerens]QDV36411.1 hypothetical protein ElP_43350 [Tautonia plasticadhaerens]
MRGARLLGGGDWDWDDTSLVEDAVERLGWDRVEDLMGRPGDGSIVRFRDGWASQEAKRSGHDRRPSQRERMRSISVGEIISAAEAGDSGYGLFRGWGMHADEQDLEAVLRHLGAAREPRVIANLLRVFTKRALPRFDDRLIGLARHEVAEVRRRAYLALQQVEHPSVREFALAGLEGGVRDGSVLGLFVRNYRRGDEHRLLEAIELSGDEDERHWLMMEVVDVLESNPEADGSRLGVVAYAETPCGNCRADAARLLLRQGVVPSWLAEELRHDACEECRELVDGTAGLT